MVLQTIDGEKMKPALPTGTKTILRSTCSRQNRHRFGFVTSKKSNLWSKSKWSSKATPELSQSSRDPLNIAVSDAVELYQMKKFFEAMQAFSAVADKLSSKRRIKSKSLLIFWAAVSLCNTRLLENVITAKNMLMQSVKPHAKKV